MKNIVKTVMITAVAFCTIFAACTHNYQPLLKSKEGVNFEVTSLIRAKQEAKQANKPLFVFVHATWCPTCKKMEHEVLSSSAAGNNFNKTFVNVAIDLDSAWGKELQKTYTISATPTLFFFSAEGTVLKKVEGFISTENLLKQTADLNNK